MRCRSGVSPLKGPALVLAVGGLLAATIACNALWGIDELHHDSGQAGSPAAPCSEPGATRPCYDGDPSTRHVGECRDGVSSCSSDGPPVWSECVGQELPVAEVCGNEADDDCDGLIDEPGDCCGEDQCVAECQANGEASGYCATDGCTCCSPSCAGKCAGEPDGCGGICQSPCGPEQCCNEQGACVPGGSDTSCGANGMSCEDCTATSRACGPAGPTLYDVAQTCLPPCMSHLRAASVTSAALGGVAGANNVCAQQFGSEWHLLASFQNGAGVAHGGGSIAGICLGDWCTDIEWGQVKMLLSASSCIGLTTRGVSSAGGIGTDTECFTWGAGQCDCGDLSQCFATPQPMGILCTDW